MNLKVIFSCELKQFRLEITFRCDLPTGPPSKKNLVTLKEGCCELAMEQKKQQLWWREDLNVCTLEQR
jgi:hypothetical protein